MSTETQEVNGENTKQPTIKPLRGYQTNCDEKNVKGRPCWGQLKIWHTAPDEIRGQFPRGEVIYRCQNCWQLYHGSPHRHVARSKRSHAGS